VEALYVNAGRYMLTAGGYFSFHHRYLLTAEGCYNLYGRYFSFYGRDLLIVEALFLF